MESADRDAYVHEIHPNRVAARVENTKISVQAAAEQTGRVKLSERNIPP